MVPHTLCTATGKRRASLAATPPHLPGHRRIRISLPPFEAARSSLDRSSPCARRSKRLETEMVLLGADGESNAGSEGSAQVAEASEAIFLTPQESVTTPTFSQ